MVGEIFGAIGLDCGEVGIWEAGVVDYYRGVDCVDYEGLTTEIRECFSKRLGGLDLLVHHFGVGVQVRVTCLSQHFAKYLSGVAI